MSKALIAACGSDHDLLRGYAAIASFISTSDELFARPGVVDAVVTKGMGAPQYPLPGRSRADLLAALN